MKGSAILVLAFATAAPACAQRIAARPSYSGHAAMGVRSAPAAHAAPAFRGGVAPQPAFRSNPRPFFPNQRAYPITPSQLHQPPARYATIAPPPAPRFYHKNNSDHSAP